MPIELYAASAEALAAAREDRRERTSGSLKERLPLLRLCGLTVAALCIHGYHLGVDDGAIYLPAARKILRPELYPFAPEFFLCHSRLSLFSSILAWTTQLTHMPMDWTVMVWYVATIFAMLSSCWLLARACFDSERARWCAVLVMTAVLAMPATNTSLLLMDPYLTARSFSTPITLFSIACFLERRTALAAASLAVMALIHPQMVVYAVSLIGAMWVLELGKERIRERVPVLASVGVSVLPTGFHFAPATGAYREALYSRDYFFLSNWAWYHWLGMLAPLAILIWFWRGKLRGTQPAFRQLSFAMVPFGLLAIAGGLVITSTHELDMFARIQPLRCFHLITIVFVLLLGGVIGEYWARGRSWVLLALPGPIALGMFVVARATYPHSPQIEWPGATSPNPWVNTLLWVRQNTPTDAVFALDAMYFTDGSADLHGFRAIAERSALADAVKDSGVAAMFPAVAVEWKQMSESTRGLNHFSLKDFQRLQEAYPMVSWTIVHGTAPGGLTCPHQQDGYFVCRLPAVSPTAPMNSLVVAATGSGQ